ncbi:DNA oxidative demethylase AlkB [Variovorax sp. SG517]|uniref:DNA oxidative demethylase AlkB n=1 Tax=Variovorax sp. SG517 TaxID=2587117 RepID=UPI00210D3DD1|nr:DNA oxidative demethylase AlkB [Variovorax sp. SG517]
MTTNSRNTGSRGRPAAATTLALFDDPPRAAREPLGTAAFVLPGFALPFVDELLSAIRAVEAQAPFRHLVTPGGFTMSVALTNCGALGWTSDRRGYRYSATDPDSGRPWPAMPEALSRLAREAASAAGFDGFAPDACLINRYAPGARLSLHQDKDERDYGAPIVSVSLGMPAVFLFGGHARADKAARVPLAHGDVVVWGGEDRLRYHGVLPLKDEPHPLLGAVRINLTFRKAG